MSKEFKYFKLTPFKWFILENFPFIEADFDALTNCELFCKIGKEMNKIIEATNLSGEQVEALTELVNNFIDTINIQEEVNNKLDEMAQDGTLEEIINQEIFSQINNNIQNLQENVENINNKIDYFNLSPIIDIIKDTNGSASLQGMAIDENDNIYQYQLTGTASGNLIVFNPKTHKQINILENINLRHGNGMVIKNNKIYSADFYSEDGSTMTTGITIYDLSNGTITHLNPFDNTYVRAFGVCDYDENNIIIALSTAEDRLISNVKFAIFNINTSNFTILNLNLKNMPTNTTGSLLCDIECINNKIYLLTSNPAQIFEFNIENNIAVLNKIYNLGVYDRQGLPYGEIEGFSKFPSNYFGEKTLAFSSMINTSSYNNTNKTLKIYLVNLETNLSDFVSDSRYESNDGFRILTYASAESSEVLYEIGTELYPYRHLQRAIDNLNNSNNIKTKGGIQLLTAGDYELGSQTGKLLNIRASVTGCRLVNVTQLNNCTGDILGTSARTIDIIASTNNPIDLLNGNITFIYCNFQSNNTSYLIRTQRGAKANFDNCNFNGTLYSDSTKKTTNCFYIQNASYVNINAISIENIVTNDVRVTGNSLAVLNDYIKERNKILLENSGHSL